MTLDCVEKYLHKYFKSTFVVSYYQGRCTIYFEQKLTLFI